MQKGALAVEVNLIEKRARMRNEKKVSFREESEPSTSSSKMERMMEEMMKKMNILERAQSRENQSAPQNRNQSQNQNQNFRRNQPQNRQREDDQQIRPPFQENYVNEDEETNEQTEDEHMNMLGASNEDSDFIYERKQGLYTPYDDRRPKTEYYEPDFENTIIGSLKQYDLRSKNNSETPNKKTFDNSAKNSPVDTSKKTTENHKTVVQSSYSNKGKNT